MIASALEWSDLLDLLPMREVGTELASSCILAALTDEPASHDVVLTTGPDFLVANEALAAARTYADGPLPDSTRRSDARDLAAFEAWCRARAVTALPAAPQTL